MTHTFTARRIVPLASLVVLALSLTGCGGDKKDDGAAAAGDPVSNGCGYKSGAASDSVKVKGDFGKDTTASFPEPLESTTLQRSVVTRGTGATPQKNAVLNVSLSMLNGKDGKSLVDTVTQKFTVGDTQLSKSLQASYSCVPLGSRVVTTVQAKDIFGDAGNPSAGVAATDTVVIVADVVEEYEPPKAAAWTDAPDVTFDGRKSPAVTLPGGEPPADLMVKVLKKGTGATVAAGDTVTLNYKGMNWRTGKVFDESYGKGKAPISFPANNFVPGFTSAIVGQRAGARLIVSIPPKLGYGESGDHELAGQTMVFVIEIQATKTTP
jgi:peptidylprolyl isomerase